MRMTDHRENQAVLRTLDRLTKISIEEAQSPYDRFDWPAELSEDAWWMSDDLLSVHATKAAEDLDEAQLKRLSKWESIHFYSLNVHGIRELLMAVVHRIHAPGFEYASEFLHRFIAEENEHMWFFAQFCNRYGAKIYPDKSIRLGPPSEDPEIESFIIFARILIFEELVDHFNVKMGADRKLPQIVQDLNRAHHQDEGRHIAAGRQLVKQLHEGLAKRLDETALAQLDQYVRRYIETSLQSLYNPIVYRDAGIPDPYGFRAKVLADPARSAHHQKFLGRIVQFLSKSNIIADPAFLK
jgi:hypothetical protein